MQLGATLAPERACSRAGADEATVVMPAMADGWPGVRAGRDPA